MQKKLVALGIAMALTGGAPHAEEPPTIVVKDTPLLNPDKASVDVENVEGVYSDSGDFLKTVNGISGVRFGGTAIDPVIRGQGQNKINVLLDGAYIYGGCPNRMDPPTSYAALDTYDKVVVEKGVHTVQYGGGGSGGTVLFERHTKRFADGEKPRVRVGASYASNGNARSAFADAASGGPQFFVRGIAESKKAENYKDGDGNEVRSAYQEQNGSLILGYTPDALTRLELNVEATRGKDNEYVGGMDAPVSDSNQYRLRFSRDGMSGTVQGVKAEVYQTDVHHVMDNYTLRPATPAAKQMKTDSESNTRGGRVSADLAGSAETIWTIGVDYQQNNRDATTYMGTTLATSAFTWPDATIAQTGLFMEVTHPTGSGRLKGGLRYDQVSASADKADSKPALPMMGTASVPNSLYQAYYGKRAENRTENNVGGFLRYDHDISTDTTWFTTISRSVRTADATERFLALWSMDPTKQWVGNPDIKPEVHQQIELGVMGSHGRVDASAVAYYDRVSDFILQDKAAGQDGILQANGATIYRNVDATLYGAELESTVRLTDAWSTHVSLAYVIGTNTTDSRPLPRIPSLNGTLSLDYQTTRWSMGGRVRAAATQTRTDTSSGLDAREEASGYGVLDLYSKLQVAENASVQFGIDNVFDHTYAETLSRQVAFEPNGVVANEPGRSVWIKGTANF